MPPTATPIECTIHIDSAACQGTGMCVSVAPTHFRLRGETAEPLSSPVALDATLIEATELCPTSAITLLGPDGEVIAAG